jgi:hypothetical protein
MGIFNPEMLEINALASALSDAMVFKLSHELIGFLNIDPTNRHLLIMRKATGWCVLRELADLRTRVYYEMSIDLVPISEFQTFRTLWSPGPSPDEMRSEAARRTQRFNYIFEVGKNLGSWHSQGFLHGDVHSGNFLPIPIDPAEARFPLLGASSHQCANDIATILQEFDVFDWACFRQGYISERGTEGQFVINLIELGKEHKFMVLQRNNPGTALPLLLQALSELTSKGANLFATYMNIGYCHSRLGNHSDAIKAYQEAEKVLDENEYIKVKMCFRLNYGQAFRRMGDYSNAAKQFERVHANTEIKGHKSGLYEAALNGLFDCYRKINDCDRAASVAKELLAILERKRKD